MFRYAEITKTNDNKSSNTPSIIRNESSGRICQDVLRPKRQLVTNYVPQKGNSSYGVWEFSYYRHLIDLRNIFINGMLDNHPELDGYLQSDAFTDDFFRFVRECSSCYISPQLELLTEQEEEDLAKFQIKRDEIQYKMGRKNRRKIHESKNTEEDEWDETIDENPTEEEVEQEEYERTERLFAIRRKMLDYREEMCLPLCEFMTEDLFFDFVNAILENQLLYSISIITNLSIN